MKTQTTITKRVLSILFVYMGLVLITQSCSKQESMHENESATEKSLVEAAKKYYNSQLRIKASADSMDIDISMYQPDWGKSVQIKTEQGLNLLGVPLKRTEEEYLELNIVSKEGNVYGIIKRYKQQNDRFYYYSGSGRLKGSGTYNKETDTFKPESDGMFSTMDFDGGELDEVIIDGGSGDSGGGDIIIDIPSRPTVPDNGNGGSVGATWSTDLVLNLPPPEAAIIDVGKYFECFNVQNGATLTVYVDQPTANSSSTWSGSLSDPDVGHTFIAIEQGDIVRVYGFYPAKSVKPYTSPASPSVLGDDSGHTYDVKISKPITAAQLTNIINDSKGYTSVYNLDSYNCTDFGIYIATQAGLSLPKSTGTWPGGGGHNPGNLGQDMRNMSVPADAATNTIGGIAISNKGTCN